MPEFERAEFEKFCCFLKPSSLPGTIRGNHYWWFCFNDWKRRGLGLRGSMVGVDGETITAIKTYCAPLPNKPFLNPEGTCCKVAPEVVYESDEEAEAPAEVAAVPHPVVATSTAISQQATSYLGWRTSYRTSEPEKPNMVKCCAKLARKNKFFEHLHLVDAERAAPPADPARMEVAKKAHLQRQADECKKYKLLRVKA